MKEIADENHKMKLVDYYALKNLIGSLFNVLFKVEIMTTISQSETWTFNFWTV